MDAKPDAVDFYQRYGFLSVDGLEGKSDARPAPIPMFLAIRAIRDALDAGRRDRGDRREG